MMPLAEVKKIACNNLRDVPLMLRNMADQIEAGEWGEVDKAVCILEYQFKGADKIDFFMWSDATPDNTYLLLHRAANKIASG